MAHLYDVVLNVPLAQARAMRARPMAPLRQWLGFCLRPPRQALAEAFKCCLAALWRKIRVMFAGQRRVSVSHCLSAGLPYMPFRLARGRVWRGVMCRFATLYGLHPAVSLAHAGRYKSKWFGSVVGRQDVRSMAKPKQSLHRQNWRMPGGSGCRFLNIRASLVPQLLVVGFNKSRASMHSACWKRSCMCSLVRLTRIYIIMCAHTFA